jgi:hypothetical protein
MAVGVATEPGLQSRIDVNSVPVIPSIGVLGQPYTWSWIWFVVAILIVAGFHIKVFGAAVPPSPRFP